MQQPSAPRRAAPAVEEVPLEEVDDLDAELPQEDDAKEGGEEEADAAAPLVGETSDEFLSAYAKILTLNVPEKIKPAPFGPRAHRSILFRPHTPPLV